MLHIEGGQSFHQQPNATQRPLPKLNLIISYYIKSYICVASRAMSSPCPYAGHSKCVEALVAWGADVDMDIPHLGTPLYTACVFQELECSRMLLREGEVRAGHPRPVAGRPRSAWHHQLFNSALLGSVAAEPTPCVSSILS